MILLILLTKISLSLSSFVQDYAAIKSAFSQSYSSRWASTERLPILLSTTVISSYLYTSSIRYMRRKIPVTVILWM